MKSRPLAMGWHAQPFGGASSDRFRQAVRSRRAPAADAPPPSPMNDIALTTAAPATRTGTGATPAARVASLVLEGNILGETKKPITTYVPRPGVRYPPGPPPTTTTRRSRRSTKIGR